MSDDWFDTPPGFERITMERCREICREEAKKRGRAVTDEEVEAFAAGMMELFAMNALDGDLWIIDSVKGGNA